VYPITTIAGIGDATVQVRSTIATLVEQRTGLVVGLLVGAIAGYFFARRAP
jgi:ABC-type xylose transport system permease subunit